jgi:7-cyano-7-deazaguanine synthase
LKKAVAIISGGLDSVGYAAHWQTKGYKVHPLIFNYGQKGSKEIEAALKLSVKLRFEKPLVLDISSLRELWTGTQLVDSKVRVEKEYKSTVVIPIRNVVFLSIASAYALSISASIVTYGAQLDDVKPRNDTGEPLYPDCHPETASTFEEILKVAHFPVGVKKVEIWSPAREGLTKAQNLRRSYEILKDLIYETWSCYLSGTVHCGECESCINRHRAFIEAGIPDKTRYGRHPLIHEKCLNRTCGVEI